MPSGVPHPSSFAQRIVPLLICKPVAPGSGPASARPGWRDEEREVIERAAGVLRGPVEGPRGASEAVKQDHAPRDFQHNYREEAEFERLRYEPPDVLELLQCRPHYALDDLCEEDGEDLIAVVADGQASKAKRERMRRPSAGKWEQCISPGIRLRTVNAAATATHLEERRSDDGAGRSEQAKRGLLLTHQFSFESIYCSCHRRILSIQTYDTHFE
ncbi:hypothetical protein BJ912DRAFT_1139995 [Pholiota molesta]|nr:hypothetical protein BJ912DRAFT_1139995 [Pholiota molesta]